MIWSHNLLTVMEPIALNLKLPDVLMFLPSFHVVYILFFFVVNRAVVEF